MLRPRRPTLKKDASVGSVPVRWGSVRAGEPVSIGRQAARMPIRIKSRMAFGGLPVRVGSDAQAAGVVAARGGEPDGGLGPLPARDSGVGAPCRLTAMQALGERQVRQACPRTKPASRRNIKCPTFPFPTSPP